MFNDLSNLRTQRFEWAVAMISNTWGTAGIGQMCDESCGNWAKLQGHTEGQEDQLSLH